MRIRAFQREPINALQLHRSLHGNCGIQRSCVERGNTRPVRAQFASRRVGGACRERVSGGIAGGTETTFALALARAGSAMCTGRSEPLGYKLLSSAQVCARQRAPRKMWLTPLLVKTAMPRVVTRDRSWRRHRSIYVSTLLLQVYVVCLMAIVGDTWLLVLVLPSSLMLVVVVVGVMVVVVVVVSLVFCCCLLLVFDGCVCCCWLLLTLLWLRLLWGFLLRQLRFRVRLAGFAVVSVFGWVRRRRFCSCISVWLLYQCWFAVVSVLCVQVALQLVMVCHHRCCCCGFCC